MGFSIADMLSGDIVKRRDPVQDNSSAGLGQMLQFLMNSNQQQPAATPKQQDYYQPSSLSELAAISAGRRKEKQQADATEQMRQLIGTRPVMGVDSTDPVLANGLPGSGVLGGKISMNQALQEMMGSSNPELAQQALATYSNLNKPRAENDNAPTGYIRNPNGSLSPMKMEGINGLNSYFDVQQANNQIPGYGEVDKLQIAKDTNVRQNKSDLRSAEREDNLIQKTDRANTLQEWRLQNPNYEKNQQSIQDAEAELAKLRDGIHAYAGTPPDANGKNATPGVIDNYDQMDRHNPLTNGSLQTEYQSMTWPLRGESMINTGVLNPGDATALNAASQDPTAIGPKGWRSNEEIKKQQWKLLEIAERNVKALRNSKTPTSPPPFSQQSYQPAPSNAPLSAQDYIKTHGGRQ